MIFIKLNSFICTELKNLSDIIFVLNRLYSLRKTVGKSVTDSGYAYVTQ